MAYSPCVWWILDDLVLTEHCLKPEVRFSAVILAVVRFLCDGGHTNGVTEAGRRELSKRITEGMGVTIDETIGGLALIVLGILALAKLDPPLLNSIATIVAGVALTIISAGLAVELNRTLSEYVGRAVDTESTTAKRCGVIAKPLLRHCSLNSWSRLSA